MTSQQNVLELAKQGNPEAIATLINRSLKPKGIAVVKAELKNGCLQIMLESEQLPNQQSLVAFICKGIKSLAAESVNKVKVYGRQTGEHFPAWSQGIDLVEESNPFSNFTHNIHPQNTSPNPSVINHQNPRFNSTSENVKNICYEVNGSNGQIRLTYNRVIICRQGITAFMTQGQKGEKEIPIKNITAIQFKRVSGMTKGFIQFSMIGYSESKGGVFDAVGDENTVMFTEEQQHEFEEIKKYIDSVMDDNPIDFSRLKLQTPEIALRARNQKELENDKEAKKSIKAVREAVVFWGVFIVFALPMLINSITSLFEGNLIVSLVCFLSFSTLLPKSFNSIPLIEKKLKLKLPASEKIAGTVILYIFSYMLWVSSLA